MEIMAKDFHKHIGKTILIPHPTMPLQILPVKVLIKGIENKKIVLEQVGSNKIMVRKFTTDKTKYKVVDEK